MQYKKNNLSVAISKKKIKETDKKKCIFFDRDNTLIIDEGYTYKTSDLIWKNGAIKAIKYLNKLNYLVIVITNQSGVARGYFKEKDVLNFHNYMDKKLKENQAFIDDFFYCPFHENAKIKKYRKKSIDRKPNNGMIKKAVSKWNIDTQKSYFIGDSDNDKSAAIKSKIKFLNISKEKNLFKFIKKIIKIPKL